MISRPRPGRQLESCIASALARLSRLLVLLTLLRLFPPLLLRPAGAALLVSLLLLTSLLVASRRRIAPLPELVDPAHVDLVDVSLVPVEKARPPVLSKPRRASG